MLPLPLIDFMPDAFDKNSTLGIAFTDKVESIFTQFRDDILQIFRLFDPIRCPVIFLEVLGQWVEAGLRNSDSDTTKRIKIANAIMGHKDNGLFVADVKPNIDAITGLDSSIAKSSDGGDWIIYGGQSTEADNLWGTLGVDGSGESFGLDLIGKGNEIEIAGNIYIDLGGDASNPTAATIAKVVEEFELEFFFAYFRIFLGFTVGDQFTVYSGGTI